MGEMVDELRRLMDALKPHEYTAYCPPGLGDRVRRQLANHPNYTVEESPFCQPGQVLIFDTTLLGDFLKRTPEE